MARAWKISLESSIVSASGLCAAVMLAASCAAQAPVRDPALPPTHGVAAEVAPRKATVWARCIHPTELHFAMRSRAGTDAAWQSVDVSAEHDFTGKATFDHLADGTRYEYRAWCGPRPAGAFAPGGASGQLVTPPAAADPRSVRFAWGGDLGGQNVCRDAAQGYSVLDRLREQSPNFFIALGDMIYADDPCKERGRFGNQQAPGPPAASTLPGYWDAWRYNRDDPALRRLFAALPYYAVWDDHEINTDAGPKQDVSPRAPGVHLLPIARRAFLDYQPIAEPAPRLYRSLRWGKHLEVFFLDTRSHRDANAAPDDPQHPKTLLGEEQRGWLLDGLERSDATWKVVVCGVPLSIPTSPEQRGRDGWANGDSKQGFENELRSILTTLHERGVRRLVFLTTDVHFATAFRYAPFPDDRSFVFHEFISGPLNAGVFPQLALDPTFGPERIFLHAPTKEIADFKEAKTWFNFGVVEVSKEGKMKVRYVDANGRNLWEGEVSEP